MYAPDFGKKDDLCDGTSAYLVHKLDTGDRTKMKVGVTYEGNSASKYSWVNYGENYENNVWFNISFSFSC
jgi:hypothetical protein